MAPGLDDRPETCDIVAPSTQAACARCGRRRAFAYSATLAVKAQPTEPTQEVSPRRASLRARGVHPQSPEARHQSRARGSRETAVHGLEHVEGVSLGRARRAPVHATSHFTSAACCELTMPS